MPEVDGSLLLSRLGAEVRRRRQSLGLSRRELAVRSGVSERFLADVESGRGNASVLKLSMLAEALKTLPSALLEVAEPLVPSQRTIALLGLRGAGKSTIGSTLADRIGRPFVELDREIERQSGLGLGQIFELNGEEYFRRIERETLDRLLDEANEPFVLATGGGLVTHRESFATLRARCATVWLRARPEDHWQRVVAQGDTRPMEGQTEAFEALRRILGERERFYELADWTVDTSDREPDAIVNELAGRMGSAPPPDGELVGG